MVGRIHPCCVFVVVIALFLQKMHSNILQEYFSFDKSITTKYFAKIFDWFFSFTSLHPCPTITL